MKEKWSPIAGWEDKYEVSSKGRVRNKRRGSIVCGSGARPRLSFWKKKKRTQILISRLVAESFIGDIPDGMVVDHINGMPSDNRVENLRIISSSENNRAFAKKRSGSASIYRGVSVGKSGCIWAGVYRDKKYKYLGMFETEIQAALARDRAAIRFGYKKEALNFPDIANETQRACKRGACKEVR